MAGVLAISGGVGGAKLALGLSRVLGAGQLSVLVNTADDFQHLGLHISPDIDTLLYTLSGRANREQGWGLEGESWSVMSALEGLQGDTWFRLGDRDLATHLYRSGRLAEGATLTEVSAELASRMNIATSLIPMSDDPVRTMVKVAGAELPFQEYFVRRRCEPEVEGFHFAGLDRARAPQALLDKLEQGLDAVVICPSNPFVSVAPVLGVPGLSEALVASGTPVVAVSPIIGGRAVKGPAAKILSELGLEVSSRSVMAHYVKHYPGLLTHALIDEQDRAELSSIQALGLEVAASPTLMRSLEDRENLARQSLSMVGL